jgi:peptidoglycan/xylan/chitin deacetylase (PgdA/CDA1 family)
MYHSISDDPELGHPYFWINTSPAIFARQLEFLQKSDYRVISLSQAVEMIRSFPDRSDLPGKQSDQTKYAVLTFDDGYRDFYTKAFPLLKARGFPATVFLPTDYIGHPQPGLRAKPHLSWEEVKDLQRQGITFGSHTCSHPLLHTLEADRILVELEQSRRVIQDAVNGCDGFCYPFKFPQQDPRFLDRLREWLQTTGYAYCLSTNIGTVNTKEDLFALNRIPINSGDDPLFFQAKLRGGYDWLHWVQAFKKVILKT